MDTTDKIQFAKPDLTRLTQKFTVADMHFHTRYSDGQNTVPQIAERARELGIGLAITDHNDIRGALEMDQYKDILSIPGIEITAKEGTHILIYFYDIKSLKRFYRKDVHPFMGNTVMSSIGLTVEEVLQRARQYNAVIIFPHPFSAAYTGICNFYFSDDQLKYFLSIADGVEVINAENLKKWNLKSTVLGFNLAKAITGGSDGHNIEEMGGCVCYADCRKTRKAVLDGIRSGQNKVVGKELDLLRKVTANSKKLKTNINNYPDIMEKNLRYGYTVIHSKSQHMRDQVKTQLNGNWRKKIFNLMVGAACTRANYNFFVFFCVLPIVAR